MNYSMVLLPDKPLMARLCDDRLGYFISRSRITTTTASRARAAASSSASGSSRRIPTPPFPIPSADRLVHRSATQPMVPWLIKGVEMWEPCSARPGSATRSQPRSGRRTIPISISTTRALDHPLAALDDRKHTAQRQRSALGRDHDANIGFYQTSRAWWRPGTGRRPAPPIPRPHAPVPRFAHGLDVAYVATHEVGHSLGLRHNMVASTYYPVDSLRSKSFTCR